MLISGGLIIGLMLVHILGIDLAGISANSTRSIGSAIVAAIGGNATSMSCL